MCKENKYQNLSTIKEEYFMDETAKDLFMAIGLIIGFFCIAGLFIPDNPKCSKYGCDSDAMEGGSYCYSHCAANAWKSYGSSKSSSTSKTSTTYNSSTSSTYKNSSSKNSSTSKNSTSSKKDSYKSYDEGYEDVYENEDYDWDRYYSDDDYADGVDDAMDELDW